nr:Ig-like domain-containing protein [uncultured Bacteroides sp.]
MNNIKYILGILFTASLSMISCVDDKDLGSVMTESFPISSITISSTDYDTEGDTICMLKNQTLRLTWITKPDNVTDPNVAWTSTYDSIAKVTNNESKNATVSTGNNLGITTLMVTPEIGFGSSASTPAKIIKVVDHFTYINSLSITNVPTKDIAIGDNYKLATSCIPSNATFKRYKWISSDPTVATVDNNGTVTGISIGKVTITATANDLNPETPASISAQVSVKKVIPIVGMELVTEDEMSQLGYGEYYQIQYKLTPADATSSLMTWASDNVSIASVDENGLVHVNSLTNGSAVITATYKNISKSVTLTVAEGRLWYSFANSLAPWAVGNSATYTSNGIKTIVQMGKSGTKYRGDLSLVTNGSGKNLTITPNTYRYLAIKIRPSSKLVAGTNSAGTIKLELYDNPQTIGYNNLGTVSSANNSYSILNGSSISVTDPNVIYYDLKAKYDKVNPTDWSKFNLVQFKFVIADYLDPATNYDIYWIRTFKTLDELNTYVNNENK